MPPGGHIKDGELTHISAKREVVEETGLEIDFICPHPLLGKIDERATVLPLPILVQLEESMGQINEDFVYLARAKTNETTNPENHKIAWFSLDECSSIETFQNIKLHISYIKKILKL